MRSDYSIFIDFDGTITARDVGYNMFRKFTDAGTQPVVDRYRRGEVNSYVCLKTECEIWNQSPPEEDRVRAYLERQEITPGFREFAEILRDRDIKHFIVSEGFDFYIDPILRAHGLSDLKRITNRAIFKKGRIEPEFPYLGSDCEECSNCKGFHLKRLTDPKEAAVFIGDGHSDFHGAESADIVFAKSFLKESLEKIGRNYFEYDDFYDIIKIWERISSRRILAVSDRLHFCRADENRRADFETLWETGEVMKNVGYPAGLGWSRERYDKFWEGIDRKNLVLFAVEDHAGNFMGEAMLSFPGENNVCSHDVKLLPEFQGRGFGREAWRILLELSSRRWPDATLEVTPSVDNFRAIELYRSLGFEPDGERHRWVPPPEISSAVPVDNLRMIKTGKTPRGNI